MYVICEHKVRNSDLKRNTWILLKQFKNKETRYLTHNIGNDFQTQQASTILLFIKEIIIVQGILMHSLFRNTFCKQLWKN